jgi:hypothetical protein
MTVSLKHIFVVARLWIVLTPFALFLTGAGLNKAVLVANGGKFPVMLNERRQNEASPDGLLADGRHCLMNADTRLNWLADFLDFKDEIASPGDLLIDLSDELSRYSLVVWITVLLIDLLHYRNCAARTGDGLGAAFSNRLSREFSRYSAGEAAPPSPLF